MMPYRMRTATPADAPFILSLHALPHVAAVLSAPTEEQVLGAMESPDLGNHLVVDGADAPVGLLLLAESTSWLYEVRRMAARDQGRGIGSFALAWALHHAFVERRAHRVYLEVHAANARARGLYEAQGFVHEGTWREGARSDDDGRYEDLCAYGILEREYRARSGC
ncbi:MAG TPA: GNAT family N-acetyltransferase [Candidatus Dormibacteraeota bacterium]|nr:GNAT family N-acetyltransferase [Candidatus Dormibacteraeota bacterium]